MLRVPAALGPLFGKEPPPGAAALLPDTSTLLHCEGKLLSDLPPLESNVSYCKEGLLNHSSLYFFFFFVAKHRNKAKFISGSTRVSRW